MKHVFWLIPGEMAGRAGPAKEPWNPQELRAAGFDTVLNLSERPPETEALVAAGLRVHWEPLPTDVPATDETEARCVAALPRAGVLLAGEVAAGRRVLVHCFAGQDRTGMLFAYHLMKRDGLAAPAAIARVRTVRPLAITAPGWETMALRVLVRVGC